MKTNKELGITQFQRNNLEKLAVYLETNPQEQTFGMSKYFAVHGKIVYFPATAAKVQSCGTVACAIGHGPYAGIVPLEGEDWETYSDRCFTQDMKAWAWCFSGSWVKVDNTPIGAAKRIRWFLEHGVPKNWYRQLRKHDTLCYDTTHLE